MTREALLEIRDLKVEFQTYAGVVKAVDIQSLAIRPGEFLGLVGETGCGKTVTSLAICGLITGPKGRIVSGEILFKGEDLLEKTPREMNEVRGKRIAMVFQDPMSSLNPTFTVGDMITRIIQRHQGVTRKEAFARAARVFETVRLPEPEETLRRFPHELSGGMRQRVMIAMALSCSPDLLIADEPTTALDVTIQAQILALLGDLKEEIDASVLLITHNLGVVAQTCDRVAVMYAGNVVEVAPTQDIFARALHPYTRGLLKALPRPGTRGKRLAVIEGVVPNLVDPPPGCRFEPRCPQGQAVCTGGSPALVTVGHDHQVACHMADLSREEAL